jgi:hypothetical protein
MGRTATRPGASASMAARPTDPTSARSARSASAAAAPGIVVPAGREHRRAVQHHQHVGRGARPARVDLPGPNPDADGARWRHPGATNPKSATIRHGLLFVYSQATPFQPTEPGQPHGYSKFRAYAVLEHGGDQRAAAQALRRGRHGMGAA